MNHQVAETGLWQASRRSICDLGHLNTALQSSRSPDKRGEEALQVQIEHIPPLITPFLKGALGER